MRALVLVLSFIATTSAFAMPVIGEKVTYKGQAIKFDGTYDVERSMEIVGYNPETKQYQMKIVYSQSAEGQSMGGYEQTVAIAERNFQSIEQSVIPMVKAQCGQVFNAAEPMRRVVTTKEYVKTGLGLLNACRVESPVASNSRTIQWWAEESQPWPMKTFEMTLAENTTIIMTVDSFVKPNIAPPQVPEAEQKKSDLPVFENPNAGQKP